MPEYIVKNLGHMGDGVVSTSTGEYYAPFTLPGEKIEASGKAKRLDEVRILDASPERADPPCPHFGKCGGCQLQHFQETAYQAWKRQLLIDNLQRTGISFPVDPLITFPANSRRKAVFNARRNGSSLEFGFAERGTNRISEIIHCIVLSPELKDTIEPLKQRIAEFRDIERQIYRILVDEPYLCPQVAEHVHLPECPEWFPDYLIHYQEFSDSWDNIGFAISRY